MRSLLIIKLLTGTVLWLVAATGLAQDDFAIGFSAYDVRDFPRIAALGIDHVRMDRPDAVTIERARSFGIEVLPIADYGFADLSDGDAKRPPLPQHRAEWARRMVDTWRGMAVPPKRIEVWNEPWHPGFWGGKPNPVEYLELVKAFAREAWAVWPNMTLLVCADTGMKEYPTFRRDLLAADTTGFLNDPRILPTVHTYVEARAPQTVTSNRCGYDLNRFRCAYLDFVAHGHRDPKVWITEFGWETDTVAPGFYSFSPVSEGAQAAYTVGALTTFRNSGMVAGAYAFMFKSNDSWNYNFLRPDNSEKPVVTALREYLRYLATK
ncbi:MAG TPA: hypothetical protein VI299_12965 [Polyangiales bacterium]